ncbi:MAG: hypothetical protein DWQ04_19940, partial [Chloroflexi bacterium]
PILDVIARLALHGPVQVIVGGNRFDAHRLARVIRRHTVQLDETLARIQQARPFTCHQTIALLADTQPATPIVMIDMLNTFYDENISDAESARLVGMTVNHLCGLGKQAPVLLTLRPPTTPARAGLIKIVQGIVDWVYVYDAPESGHQPPLLF